MKLSKDISLLIELIKSNKANHDTFISNLDIAREIYQNRKGIIGDNLQNEELYLLIGFLLKHEKGEVSPTFASDIIGELTSYQEQFVISANTFENISTNKINGLLKNLEFHDYLSNIIRGLSLEDNGNKIKKYLSRTLELYTILALINIIYYQLIYIEPDSLIDFVIYIEKTMLTLQQDNVRFNNKNDELIESYFTKFLKIKRFLGESIEEDSLINQMRNGKIKNKKLLIQLIKKIPVHDILTIFDYDLATLLDFLNNVDYLEIFEKEELAFEVFHKLEEEKLFLNLIELIINDNKNPLWLIYATAPMKYMIITNCLKKSVAEMNDDTIKYLLTIEELKCPITCEGKTGYEEFQKLKSNFIYECRYLMRRAEYLSQQESFDLGGVKQKLAQYNELYDQDDLAIRENDNINTRLSKTRKRYQQGIDIEFKDAIYILDEYFRGNVKLDLLGIKAIVRSISTEMIRQQKLPNNGIYFFNEKEKLGNQYCGIIEISKKVLEDFLNKKLTLYERLLLFVTNFHEINHAKIYDESINKKWTIDTYDFTREQIMRQYDTDFYNKNYVLFLTEINAEIEGFDMLMKFIEIYFPMLLETIQDQIIRELTELKKSKCKQNDYTRVVYLFGEIKLEFNNLFDTVIRYNPDILKLYPIFELEYTKDGQVKTPEAILSSSTNENKEIINAIIKRRYPEFFNHKRRI